MIKSSKQINKLRVDLEQKLTEECDKCFSGDSMLHESFTVNINGCTISLGSMDTYDLFHRFMLAAERDAEELDLEFEEAISLSIAESNCLIEAIDTANQRIDDGIQVYCIDGYQADDEQTQRSYAAVTDNIASNLKKLIDKEQTAVIVFEP